jgi:hypothetical protein
MVWIGWGPAEGSCEQKSWLVKEGSCAVVPVSRQSEGSTVRAMTVSPVLISSLLHTRLVFRLHAQYGMSTRVRA